MPAEDEMTVDERWKHLRKIQKRYVKAERHEKKHRNSGPGECSRNSPTSRTRRDLSQVSLYKTLNRARMAASTSAGNPGGACACNNCSTRAVARARVSSLPAASHAARFWRSASGG